MKHPKKIQAGEENTVEENSLNYLLDILKLEIEIINKSVEHIIDNIQTTKNWAIVTWTGSFALFLGQPDLHQYIIVSAIPPFMFWYADAWWRSIQSRYAFRASKIGEVLNSKSLAESFQAGNIVGLYSFDPSGRIYKEDESYKSRTSISQTAMFPEVIVFYLPLILISILAEVIMLVK